MSTLHDQLHEFSRDRYNFENERREKLLDRIGLISVVLVIIGNITAAFLGVIPMPFQFRYTHLLFYVPFASGLVLAGISFWESILAVIPREYLHLSVTKVNELVQKSKTAGMSDEDTKLGLTVLLAEQYSSCASYNAHLNTLRSGHVYWGLRLALVAVGALVLACPGYLKMKSDLPDKATNVKITQPVEIKK